jgi:hypothetical protein
VRVPLLDRSMEAKMSAETSVGCVYCVVYQLRQKEWVPLNLKWVHVYLYRDDRDNTHRFVGWTVEDRSLVLNLNVNGSCDYKEKSPDFHRFIGEGGLNETYGFGFHIGNEELAEAKAFKQMVLAIVSPSLLSEALGPSAPPCSFSFLYNHSPSSFIIIYDDFFFIIYPFICCSSCSSSGEIEPENV